jgi:hypothetical protein
MEHPRDIYSAMVSEAECSEDLVVADQVFEQWHPESELVTWECRLKKMRLLVRLDGIKLMASKLSSVSITHGLSALRKGKTGRLDFDTEYAKSASSRTFVFDMGKGFWLSGTGSYSNAQLAHALCNWLISNES